MTDYKRPPKTLLVEILNHENETNFKDEDLYFDTPIAKTTLKTLVDCYHVDWDIAVTLSYERMDIGELLELQPSQLIVSGLSDGLQDSESPIWPALADKYPILFSPFQWDAVVSGGDCTVTPIPNNLAFVGEYSILLTETRVDPVLKARLFLQKGGRDASKWVVVYPVGSTSKEDPYDKYWLIWNGLWYSVGKATADYYRKKSRRTAEIFEIPRGAAMPAGKKIAILKQGINDNMIAIDSTVRRTDGSLHEAAIRLVDEVTLLKGRDYITVLSSTYVIAY